MEHQTREKRAAKTIGIMLLIKIVSIWSCRPNKPTAAIIGEYSYSCNDGALIYPLALRQEFQSDINLTRHYATHH